MHGDGDGMVGDMLGPCFCVTCLSLRDAPFFKRIKRGRGEMLCFRNWLDICRNGMDGCMVDWLTYMQLGAR